MVKKRPIQKLKLLIKARPNLNKSFLLNSCCPSKVRSVDLYPSAGMIRRKHPDGFPDFLFMAKDLIYG